MKNIILWTNLQFQVLPLRNHHIIILAFFPKSHAYRWLVLWVGGGGVMETWFNARDSDEWIFFNTGEVVLVRLGQFAIVRMSFACLVFLFLNDRGQTLRIYVYVIPPLPPTVQYIQVFLPAKPPLRKGCTREMIHTVGGFTQGYQTDSCNQRLCKISLSFGCRTSIGVGNTTEQVFSFFVSRFVLSPLYSHHLVFTASPLDRGGCLIACIHTRVLHLDFWI